MRFGRVPVAEAEGAVLAHAVTGAGLSFKKGRVLSAADIEVLRAQDVRQVLAAVFEDGDVPEDEAAAELAGVVAGRGVRVAPAFTGRSNLFARERGVLVVDGRRIDRLNQAHEAITLATLPAYAVVEPEQMVATVKIIPFAAPSDALAECLDLAAQAPLVQVAPFSPRRYGLIQTFLPGTSAKMLDKTARVTAERVQRVGGEIAGESRCEHDSAALAAEIGRRAPEADVLLVVGASAITDRRDVLPAGIVAAGGAIQHLGMPVDPGNLLLLGELDGRPVLGLPGCARSPKLNGFDWVLERLAAGIDVTPRDIMRMGVGGLLMEIPSRPQPRQEKEQAVAPARPRIGAVVLAGGQSRRMGERNKLLLEVNGRPMVRHAVEAALEAGLREVVIVTGHERQRLEEAVAGLPVRLVHNPDFALGLSTSLKRGLQALDPSLDGVLVLLGDMPLITAGHLRRLIGAFNPIEGRGIVVPTHRGKRGNPVLWARSFFQAMRDLEGDVGAKHLLGEHAGELVEVELEDEAPLVDIDTPEALSRLGGAGA
jgi:molybdenum cofactor cytidylyltransferase